MNGNKELSVLHFKFLDLVVGLVSVAVAFKSNPTKYRVYKFKVSFGNKSEILH